MIQESTKEQLIERWIDEPGYTIASNRIELLARILSVSNPDFAEHDFSKLKVLDIGCGGEKDESIQSEHRFDNENLWRPWFLRIVKLLNASVRDGVDVVPQTQEDLEDNIYRHTNADIFKAFLNAISLQDLLQQGPETYNLINCTNVIDITKLSPYLDNLIQTMGLQFRVDEIIGDLFRYILDFALFALEENGLLAIDKHFYIKRNGKLVNLLEQ